MVLLHPSSDHVKVGFTLGDVITIVAPMGSQSRSKILSIKGSKFIHVYDQDLI